jgi:hypothetical protein
MLSTALVFALAASLPLQPVDTSMAAVLADRDNFDGKAVRVVGTVEKYDAKTSRRGNPYTVLVVAEGGARLSVYHRQHQSPAPKKGDRVEVVGVYQKERKVGSGSVKDQIDATAPQGGPVGVKKV